MRDERRDIRNLVQQLTPEQWQADSRCEGWTVRDLVAHLLAWDDLLMYRTRWEHVRLFNRFMVLYVTSAASMARLNRRLVARGRQRSIDDLRHQLGRDDSPDLKWLFDGTNPGAHLAEYVIHRHDLARPLGLPCAAPTERMIGALNGVTNLPGVRLRARWLLVQRRWQAIDADWSRGRGPRINALAEEILLALAGRTPPPSSNTGRIRSGQRS
jgi:uncharacterized protein (TIGR03083 family)